MTYKDFEKQFRAKANTSGYSEDNIVKCLLYARPLLEKNLPVIFNTSNLAALVGYRKNYIKKAVLYPTYFYREFQVKKKTGSGLRTIREPLPSLKEIQFWILENILYEIPVSKYAKAYVKNRTLKDNVKYHKGKKLVVCLDIKDFFPSIKRKYVEEIFLNIGYSSNISNLLSKLCTCDEYLPQGAVTSPCLSNIFMVDFDAELSNFCMGQMIRFTRYADDITLSGDFNPDEVIHFISLLLCNKGLVLNKDKIKIMHRNTPQIVTGVMVNKKIQMPRSKRDEIRQEVYFIKKLGIETHLSNTNNTRANYLRHLLGKVNYAIFLNPSDSKMQEYSSYLKGLIKLFPNH